MVVGRNLRDNNDYFMLPRGQPQKRQGGAGAYPGGPGMEPQQNMVHLPSIAQQYPVTIKSQQSIIGNGGGMGVSLLETVAINRNRPSPGGNIPVSAKYGSPMMVPSVALLGSVPSYRQMTTTEPLGAGFYRPRTVAKPVLDIQARRGPMRPQTQPPVQPAAKDVSPMRTPGLKMRSDQSGAWLGHHDLTGKEATYRANGGLISRGNSIPKLLPKVPGGVRNQAPLRQRARNDPGGYYKLKVPSEGLAQFANRGDTPQDGSFGAAIGRAPVFTPPSGNFDDINTATDQNATPKSRGEPFGRSTLDMGRGQFGFNDTKGAARENYGIRGSYNPHAFLSPSRGGPRDASPPTMSLARQEALRASTESYNSPMLSVNYLKHKASIGPVLGNNNSNRKARSRPMEASQKTTNQIKQKRAGGRSTVLAMGQPNPVELLQRMEEHRKREPYGPMPSSMPSGVTQPPGVSHTTLTSRPTTVTEGQEKVLKEHHHVGVPIPPGQQVTPSRASSSSTLPVQQSKTQPIQEFESSLSHMPLPWGGSSAPPAVLQDAIFSQDAPLSPMLGPPDSAVQEPATPIAEPQVEIDEQATPAQEPAAMEPPASTPEEPQAEAADQLADSTMEEAQAEVPSVAEAEAPALAVAEALPKDEAEPAPLVEASAPEEQQEASAAPAESQPVELIDEPMVQEEPPVAPGPETVEEQGSDAAAAAAAVASSSAGEEEPMASEAVPLPDAPKEVEVMAAEAEEDMEQAQLSAEDEFDKGTVETGGEQGDKLGMGFDKVEVRDDEVMSNFSSNADDCTDLMVAPIDDGMDEVSSAIPHYEDDDIDDEAVPHEENIRVLNDCYEVIQVVGEGAYGLVMKCKMRSRDTYVAIKEFKIEDDDPDADDVRRTSQREVELLRELQHPHVVGFIEDFYVKDRLFIVMEFVPCNLLEVLESHHGGLGHDMIRSVMFQLITSITFIHNLNIVYRDIKPENLLVTNTGKIKLCDFGFARHVERPDQTLTDYVATRWYRAPELLLGPPWKETGSVVPLPYGPGVDMWAIGCLMGELVDGEPLFAGDSDIDQLYKIQKIQGPVPEHQWDLFNRNPNNTGIVFNVRDPLTLRKRYEGKLDEVELDFMEGLLALDPAKRLTGPQCLEHPYLKGMQDASIIAAVQPS